MKTKTIIQLFCDLVLKYQDKAVCHTKDAVEYQSLKRSSTLNNFFHDDKRNAPTGNICSQMIDLCRFHLYPLEFRNNDAYRNDEAVIAFSCRVLYFLTSVFKRNYSAFAITDESGAIHEEKRDILFLLMQHMFQQMKGKEEFDSDAIIYIIENTILNLGTWADSDGIGSYHRKTIHAHFQTSLDSFHRLEYYKKEPDKKPDLNSEAHKYLKNVDKFIDLMEAVYNCYDIYSLQEIYNLYYSEIYPSEKVPDLQKEMNGMKGDYEELMETLRYKLLFRVTSALCFDWAAESLKNHMGFINYIDYVNEEELYIIAINRLRSINERLTIICEHCTEKMKSGRITGYYNPDMLMMQIHQLMDYLLFQHRVLMDFSIE